MSNAEAMLKPSRSNRTLKQLDVDVEVDTDVDNNSLLPATARYYVDDRPAKIATEAVKRLDELALLGYPILDPATRSVYEVVIRHVAEGVLES